MAVKTQKVIEEGIPGFDWTACEDDSSRIRRISSECRNAGSVLEAFVNVYGTKFSKKTLKNAEKEQENFVLYVGKFIQLNVEEVTARGLRLSSPYIKEEIINKDNMTIYPQFRSYLLQNNNQVIGVVAEINSKQVKIDVLNAYYKLWVHEMNEVNIAKEQPVQVYDLELTRGGFLGKVNITHLSALTGQPFVNTCFIPGSQIVLNIEHNFENWIGESVSVLPQKFTQFSTQFSRTDNCLLCSRKQLLQYQGAENLYNLYAKKQLVEKMQGMYTSEILEGEVTGVIKSNKKCGVFIELDGMYITGMLPCDTFELAQYAIGDKISVRIKEFETTSDKTFKKNKNGNIQWPNMRVVFELA